MVKFHFGNLGCEKGWSQNHSKYGTYQHAHYHFRFKFHLLMSFHAVQYFLSIILCGLCFLRIQKHCNLITENLISQAAMVKDTPISVRRVTWSHDGSFVGM
jgi:hypothetical protein